MSIRTGIALVAALAGAGFAAEVEALSVEGRGGSSEIYVDTFSRVGTTRPNSRGGEDYQDSNGVPAGRSVTSFTGAIQFFDSEGVYTGEMVPNHSTGFDVFSANGTYLGQTITGFRGVPEYFDAKGRHLNYSLFLLSVSDLR
jgi:hypothetical protein